MKKFAVPALLLLATAAHASLYKWTGSLDFGTAGAAPDGISGTFDVQGDSIRLCTLNFDQIAWSGFTTPFPTVVPSARANTMYVADMIVSGNTEGGDFQFAYNDPDSAGNGMWFFDTGSRGGGGRILSFAQDSAPVPEPSSFVLMASAFGGLGLLRRRRRNR